MKRQTTEDFEAMMHVQLRKVPAPVVPAQVWSDKPRHSGPDLLFGVRMLIQMAATLAGMGAFLYGVVYVLHTLWRMT
jgi:hypothetical protein